MNLAIKLNNAATNDPCAICGARTDPNTGPELFLADSWALVCRKCGQRYAPELVGMLQAWGSIQWSIGHRQYIDDCARQGIEVEEVDLDDWF